MNRKIALVTGGSDGVGLSIAKALAEASYEVHFIGMNPTKGQAVERNLKLLTNKEIKFWPLDLSDMRDIIHFLKAFKEYVPHLDRLVLSAGVVSFSRLETKQGFEKTFAVNYLSAYLISHHLKKHLEKADGARVLLVSGDKGLALKANLNFEDLHASKAYQGIKAAAQAIHAKTVLAQILDEQWSSSNITVNAFHPGIVKSSLGRHFPMGLNHIAKLGGLIMPSKSATGIDAVLSSKLSQVSGCHLSGKKQNCLAFESNYCDRLGHETKKMLANFL